MEEHKRLDELRRRVEKDPASIAFASLAEELRRAGDHDEAVRVCREGLEYHPTYLSARVTLGRALLELQQYPEARTELQYVIHAAPDNLLAQKCMSELEARAGDPALALAEALGAGAVRESGPPSQHWPVGSHSDPTVAEAAGPHAGSAAAAPPAKSLSFIASGVSVPVVEPTPEPAASPVPSPFPPPHPALGELERWRAHIQADRAERMGRGGLSNLSIDDR